MKPIFEQYSDFIKNFKDFQEKLQNPLENHIRINGLKTEAEPVIGALRGRGIDARVSLPGDHWLYFAPNLESPGNLLEYFLGYIHPQAFTSCLAALALAPREEACVLDLCAAPGGKTAHLAQLLHNKGLIVANELHPTRQVSLGHTLVRLGVLNTVITAYQAQQFPLKQKFDYVMADVPCSGEGRFRKQGADHSYRATAKKPQLPKLQKKIILRGFDLLKENGELLYATCTYNPDENEGVVNWLLLERDAEVLPINLSAPYEPGLLEWRKQSYAKEVRKACRFYPHITGSVGFFMARIGRSR
jgi:NOL1/NOP2/sun family putative RNA methylase